MGAHGLAGDEASLNELVGVTAHNLAIFAGAWLALVSVDNKIMGPEEGVRGWGCGESKREDEKGGRQTLEIQVEWVRIR